ncbi:hypothetical protein PF010_g30110 [Phytophthora fragariae]|uniref:Uncharacterized protein n=1 Tax=Phytophthora fragariae TaxID=53985 RepID=A0A6A3GWR2_9STRA|nr:hypothetical protein PF011_g29825 [Phytophthora fragariae]KAE9060708.1 hypothetical protein PF010_g30110 [Phytophthora fragariae]KAE9275412.1 hypothetical protein PF008_g29359 [Phytophthora fragariae]
MAASPSVHKNAKKQASLRNSSTATLPSQKQETTDIPSPISENSQGSSTDKSNSPSPHRSTLLSPTGPDASTSSWRRSKLKLAAMSRLTPTCDSAFTSSIVGVRPWRIESMTQGGEMSSTCRQERLHRVQDALQVGAAVLQRHELRHVGPVLQHGGVGAQEHGQEGRLILAMKNAD